MDSGFKGRKCNLCNKSLKTIGLQRINGDYNYCDWATRDYHKKCYKIIKLRDEMDEDCGRKNILVKNV